MLLIAASGVWVVVNSSADYERSVNDMMLSRCLGFVSEGAQDVLLLGFSEVSGHFEDTLRAHCYLTGSAADVLATPLMQAMYRHFNGSASAMAAAQAYARKCAANPLRDSFDGILLAAVANVFDNALVDLRERYVACGSADAGRGLEGISSGIEVPFAQMRAATAGANFSRLSHPMFLRVSSQLSQAVYSLVLSLAPAEGLGAEVSRSVTALHLMSTMIVHRDHMLAFKLRLMGHGPAFAEHDNDIKVYVSGLLGALQLLQLDARVLGSRGDDGSAFHALMQRVVAGVPAVQYSLMVPETPAAYNASLPFSIDTFARSNLLDLRVVLDELTTIHAEFYARAAASEARLRGSLLLSVLAAVVSVVSVASTCLVGCWLRLMARLSAAQSEAQKRRQLARTLLHEVGGGRSCYPCGLVRPVPPTPHCAAVASSCRVSLCLSPPLVASPVTRLPLPSLQVRQPLNAMTMGLSLLLASDESPFRSAGPSVGASLPGSGRASVLLLSAASAEAVSPACDSDAVTDAAAASCAGVDALESDPFQRQAVHQQLRAPAASVSSAAAGSIMSSGAAGAALAAAVDERAPEETSLAGAAGSPAGELEPPAPRMQRWDAVSPSASLSLSAHALHHSSTLSPRTFQDAAQQSPLRHTRATGAASACLATRATFPAIPDFAGTEISHRSSATAGDLSAADGCLAAQPPVDPTEVSLAIPGLLSGPSDELIGPSSSCLEPPRQLAIPPRPPFIGPSASAKAGSVMFRQTTSTAPGPAGEAARPSGYDSSACTSGRPTAAGLSADQVDILQAMRESVSRLVRLTNDSLDLERVETATLPLVRAEASLRRELRSAMREVSIVAESKGVPLRLVDPAAGTAGREASPSRAQEGSHTPSPARAALGAFPAPAPPAGSAASAGAAPCPLDTLVFDRDRLRQVCINLISNAVRHSPRGSPVTLTVLVTPRVDPPPRPASVATRVAALLRSRCWLPSVGNSASGAASSALGASAGRASSGAGPSAHAKGAAGAAAPPRKAARLRDFSPVSELMAPSAAASSSAAATPSAGSGGARVGTPARGAAATEAIHLAMPGAAAAASGVALTRALELAAVSPPGAPAPAPGAPRRTVPVTATIHISDCGSGLPPDKLSGLFQPFFQLHEPSARRDGEGANGSGLGLAISKALMELMGGSLSVASQEGLGAIFTASFPTVAVLPPDHAAPDTTVWGAGAGGAAASRNPAFWRDASARATAALPLPPLRAASSGCSDSHMHMHPSSASPRQDAAWSPAAAAGGVAVDAAEPAQEAAASDVESAGGARMPVRCGDPLPPALQLRRLPPRATSTGASEDALGGVDGRAGSGVSRDDAHESVADGGWHHSVAAADGTARVAATAPVPAPVGAIRGGVASAGAAVAASSRAGGPPLLVVLSADPSQPPAAALARAPPLLRVAGSSSSSSLAVPESASASQLWLPRAAGAALGSHAGGAGHAAPFAAVCAAAAPAAPEEGDSRTSGRQTSAPGAGADAPQHLSAMRRGSSCRSESVGSAAGGFLSLSISSGSVGTPMARDPGPFAGLGLRGLVVDDTASNLKLLVRLLYQLGVAEVATAEHGEAALAVMRLRRAQHDAAAARGAAEGAPRPGAAAATPDSPDGAEGCTPPAAAAARAASASRYALDFILLDRHMPVMDGEECARALRGADFGYAGPIIAVSADADAAFLRAGADDICQKPVSRSLLVSLLRKHLCLPPAVPPLELPSHDSGAAPPRVGSTTALLSGR